MYKQAISFIRFHRHSIIMTRSKCVQKNRNDININVSSFHCEGNVNILWTKRTLVFCLKTDFNGFCETGASFIISVTPIFVFFFKLVEALKNHRVCKLLYSALYWLAASCGLVMMRIWVSCWRNLILNLNEIQIWWCQSAAGLIHIKSTSVLKIQSRSVRTGCEALLAFFRQISASTFGLIYWWLYK